MQVENSEGRDEMSYVSGPQTEFQRFIRLPKEGAITSVTKCSKIFISILLRDRVENISEWSIASEYSQ